MTAETQSNNPQQASDAAKARRLAFLLTQSVMPQEQKEAWIHLLPVMESSQVDVLMEILEKEHAGYIESSKTFLDDLKRLEGELTKQVESLKQEEKQLIEAYVKQAIEKYAKED